MNPLSLIPSWGWAGLVTALGVAWGVQTVRLADEKADHATTHAAYAGERTKAAQASQRAEKAERELETHRQEKKDEIIELARMESKRVAAARESAAIAGRDMLNAARALAARACEVSANPAPGPGSAPAPAPAVVLADVLGSTESAERELAEALDRSRSAGLSCERSYDSLTP